MLWYFVGATKIFQRKLGIGTKIKAQKKVKIYNISMRENYYKNC